MEELDSALPSASDSLICGYSIELENLRADDTFVREQKRPSFHQCEPIQKMNGSMQVGAPASVSGEVRFVAPQTPVAVVPEEVRVVGKQKRGRPSKGQVKAPPKMRKDEEDVCFICFDGGKLVLCDRRGCPKAYHPACIKRDEAFFRSKARWNCGWHICSSCEKAAHYMCYTCTYSLCKVCISVAEFVCVRGNKGFCTTCMRTIMLIENNVQGDAEMVQVDFDDKSSWEYLFKVYWIYLKGKLSLSLEELTKAKNPWKGAGALSCQGESSGELYDVSNDKGSISDVSSRNKVGNDSKRKMEKHPKFPNKKDAQNVVRAVVNGGTSFPHGAQWASEELLDFIAHMRDGDTSIISQFEVQTLLLEYIKRNNLRDPHRKSQIICDPRLGKLFGKARVAHFEMLKLLEFHFLIKENSRLDCMLGGFVGSQVDADRNNDNQLILSKDKRCKTRKKCDSRGAQTNLDEYAAINVYNVNLIYLRRSLMENLLEDAGKFSEKVVGAIVRIRISSDDKKQDMYRLVHVLGTSKAAVPYKVGQRTADVMLEILNLNKKEAISIDAISNQEFSEDECKRLCQSIKCGVSKRLTVGEIQEKAMALREVKLTDCLESEILRLSHLRDRASEKGRRKELRECVEKLELLKTPEERCRRLHEIPEVHADPTMGLTYDPEENAREPDEKKEDLCARSRIIVKGREPISPWGGRDVSNNTGSGLQNNCEPNKNTSTTIFPHKEFVSRAHGRASESWNQGRDAYKLNNCENLGSQVDLAGSASFVGKYHVSVRPGSSPVVAAETLTSILSSGIASSVSSLETDKIWHYQDPNGKMQGPFCMVQLRKWSTTGYFPPDMRIWRIGETQDDSILLTDALLEPYSREQPLLYARVTSDDRKNYCEAKSEGLNLTLIDKQNKGANWNIPAGFAHLKQKHAESFSGGGDVFSGIGSNSWTDQPQMTGSLPSPKLLGKPCEAVLQQCRERHEGEAPDSCQDHETNAHRSTMAQTHREQNNEIISNSCDHPGQSSGQNWKPPLLCGSSNGWDSNSTVAKSSETSEQHHENDFPGLPSPTPKRSDLDLKDQSAENKPSVASNAPAGSSWSSASSLVGCEEQRSKVAGEWGGHSPNSAKPSVEEWETSLVSASLLRLAEAASDRAATPNSNTDQLTHSSASHPATDTSIWQAIVSGPNEFSSLGEESVSDLLAEVDAMELNGLPSPTSIMNCAGGFAQGSKNDCFSSIEVLSPTLEPGKSDALSSTGDLQFPFKLTMVDEPKPQGFMCADVLNARNRSSGQSSTSAEGEGKTKPSDVSVNQEPSVPSSKSWETTATDSAWGASETTDNGSGPVHGNANLGWGGVCLETTDNGQGPVQGNPNLCLGGTAYRNNNNMGWGPISGMTQENETVHKGASENGNLGCEAVSGTAQENANAYKGPQAGNQGVLRNQPKYTGSGQRYSGSRDRGFQDRDSSFVRNRPSWNRQSSFGGGGSSRPLPKAQRVCRFYESGHCKKGAFCDYLHP